MPIATDRTGECGNVLFLVLIAVVLFAALSYAVTRSTQTNDSSFGGIDTIGSATLNQNAINVRMAVMKIEMMSGTDDFEFNAPSNFSALGNIKRGVFHPQGGGAVYQTAPTDIMESGMEGIWHYNAEFEIENLGLDAASSPAGNDIVAFLPGIRRSICEKINDKIGLGSTPEASTDLSAAYGADMDNTYSMPAGETVIGAAAGNGTDNLSGKPFGCFRNGNGDYVYFHTISER